MMDDATASGHPLNITGTQRALRDCGYDELEREKRVNEPCCQENLDEQTRPKHNEK